MITCPNCNHQNPDGANQCEACYTPLPNLMACPSCGSEIQANASFCGQCGADLRAGANQSAPPQPDSDPETPMAATASSFSKASASSYPESTIKTQNFLNLDSNPAINPAINPDSPDPLAPDPLANPSGDPAVASATPNNPPDFDLPDLIDPDPLLSPDPISGYEPAAPQSESSQVETPQLETPQLETPSSSEPVPAVQPPAARPVATQLQTLSVRLRHVQTDTPIEIPRQLSVVRIGKPNDQTPPDIDVSGFPDSEIVSRTHANLRVEGDVYYIEDVGSSNGTYVNGLPLAAGNRHRLRPGDRIALGKGDKVSFIFEAAS